jgi:DNA-damage-inducible protein D
MKFPGVRKFIRSEFMNKNTIQKLQNQFDALSQRLPDGDVEFWFARDLLEPLGYSRWENFQTAIMRAIESCETTGYDPDNHFRGVTKMVKLGSGAQRQIEDFILTRYACYLIAQNGDPRKEPIAFAQSYRILIRIKNKEKMAGGRELN